MLVINSPHDYNMSDLDDTFGEFLAYAKVAFMSMVGDIVDQMAWQTADEPMRVSWWGCGSNKVWVVVHIDE